MRECIVIQLGKAGIQIGQECWELFCLEHGIQPNGMRLPTGGVAFEDQAFGTYFRETGAGKYVPRGLFVDFESPIANEVKTGPYRELFHPDLQFVTGETDSSSNYALGRSLGEQHLDAVMDRIRIMTEYCSGLSGFSIIHSTGGGCGSAFGRLLMSRLSTDYRRKSTQSFTVYPSSCLSQSVLEPYNTVLASHPLIQKLQTNLMYQNDAIYRRLHAATGHSTSAPNYADLNAVIAQTISCMTASSRFDGALNADLSEFQTGLVPYTTTHFMTVSYSPVIPPGGPQTAVVDLTKDVFLPGSPLSSCNLDEGKHMSALLLFQGPIPARDVNQAVMEIKSEEFAHRPRFVDWAPTGFKCGITQRSPVQTSTQPFGLPTQALCGVFNTSASMQVFEDITTKFDRLYAKRAFVHFLTSEGMEEGELFESREDVESLMADYREIAIECEDLSEEEEEFVDEDGDGF